MTTTYLIRVGEITLKGGNRSYFEKRLMKNIRRRVRCSTSRQHGRFFVEVDEHDESYAESVLESTFGIVGFARVIGAEKTYPAIVNASETVVREYVDAVRGRVSGTFKIEARRSDKSFELSSQEIADKLGDELRERFPDLSVDVHDPDLIIHIEIRNKAFVFGNDRPGPGGLPVGSAGRGMLLLSGGIDSPIAGYLLAKRGLKIDAVYFHTYPYTGNETREKVENISRKLAPHTVGHTLHVVDFSEIAVRIKRNATGGRITLLLRAAMMDIASRIAERRKALALITGESLSQVASQTVESIRFTDSYASFPVYRPLIGYDKQEIISIARKIGTYEISILPYEDCCTVFTPENPVIKPDFGPTRESFASLELESYLQTAADRAENYWFDPAEHRGEKRDGPGKSTGC